MLKGCVQNLRRECADLAVGLGVSIGQIRRLVLQCNMCLIDRLSPNSLFAAEKCITSSQNDQKTATRTTEKKERRNLWLKENL